MTADPRRGFSLRPDIRSAPVATAAALALAMMAGCSTAAASQTPQPQPASRPGATNTLADVPGLQVGHYQRMDGGFRTGTTVILTPDGATASYDVQGGGPGTKETDLLVPGGLVTEVHAIVLSGGSAYGLDSATGVMRWLEEQGKGYPIAGGVVPIVPAAILFDLGRGGDFKARPDADFGYRAAQAASTAAGAVPIGRVGAGAGARHGLGSASVVLPNGYTVAAIVGLNPGGSPVDPTTCLPYGLFLELDNEFNLATPNPAECPGAGSRSPRPGIDGPYENSFNTTIALVATDAPLDQTQAQRMAQIANSGLSRSIRPVHNLGDGDAVFAMATTTPPAPLTNQELHILYNAAADALGRAVVHALLRDNYCENYPSACRLRSQTGNPPRD